MTLIKLCDVGINRLSGYYTQYRYRAMMASTGEHIDRLKQGLINNAQWLSDAKDVEEVAFIAESVTNLFDDIEEGGWCWSKWC